MVNITENAEENYAVAPGFLPDAHFKLLLENLPAGAYTCDMDGLITYANERAVQLWGRAPALLNPLDRWCGSFKLFSIDGTPIPHDQCWMALAIKNQKGYNNCEIVVERPDGKRWTALAHANPLFNAEGELTGAVNVLLDITARKESERLLKQSDRAKDEFLAVLSHELRNPLAPLRNAIEILRIQKDPTDSAWALSVMERQIVHITRLVDDLMDVARINENKLELQQRLISVGDIVNAAVETSRPILEASKITLSIEMPHHPLYLQGDLVRLSQVISNLLHNVARYTPTGGSATLSVVPDYADFRIMIRDTGIGITAEMLPKIFDLFAQGKRSDGPRSGLGIGLTLVKRIVEMHGGSVKAESGGAGKGSQFTVSLPIAPSSSFEGAPHSSPEEERLSTNLKVLIVDDNHDAANTMRTMLRDVCGEVRVAYDGLEALKICEEFVPDIVFLDIGMPTLNGHDTARRVREHSWGKQVILVAVSGWGQSHDRVESKSAGFDDHLVKPADPAVLMRILRGVEMGQKMVLS